MTGAGREKISSKRAFAHTFQERHQRFLAASLAQLGQGGGKGGLGDYFGLDACVKPFGPSGAMALGTSGALFLLDQRFQISDSHMHESSPVFGVRRKLRRVQFVPS